jgi:hypothetical protein
MPGVFLYVCNDFAQNSNKLFFNEVGGILRVVKRISVGAVHDA